MCATLDGAGGGRSLLLTGHMDTVALGENDWSVDPFGGEIREGRLYGLGSVDMKGAMGAMLVLVKALVEQDIRLKGTLSYECVVDEEEAGVNATIAGRLRHGPLDAAIIPEITSLQVYPAARGALITDILFTNKETTWLEVGTDAEAQADVVAQIGLLLTHLDDLRSSRRSHPVPPLYRSYPDPVPVQVTKIYAGGWGSQVPIAVPADGKIELIVQTLPGENRADVLQEVENWLDDLVGQHPTIFTTRPQVALPPTLDGPDRDGGRSYPGHNPGGQRQFGHRSGNRCIGRALSLRSIRLATDLRHAGRGLRARRWQRPRCR